MVNIFDKIDQIREKPEYIRRRYVWLFVTIFMFLIIGIWIISLKSSLMNSGASIKDANRLDITGADQTGNSNASAPIDYQKYYNDLQKQSAQSSVAQDDSDNSGTDGSQDQSDNSASLNLLTPGQ